MLSQVAITFLLSCLCMAVLGQSKPSFCKTYDCPLFESKEMTGGITNRTYTSDTNWVGTTVVGGKSRGMFRKLFSYIRGANDKSMKIDMTVPVLTKFETKNGQEEVTMLFYLAVPNPPQPTGEGVFLQTISKKTHFAVKSYTTYFWVDRSFDKNLNLLKNAVNGMTSTSYNPNVYYKVGYNSPWDFKKYNEVLMEQM